MKTSTCIYCSVCFTINLGSYGKFCSLSCGTAYRNKTKSQQAEYKYNLNPHKCQCCQVVLDYQKRSNKYCSSICSAKVTNLIARKRGPRIKKKEKVLFSSIKFILCKHTNQFYSSRNSDGSIRRCSPYIKSNKENYYAAARFKFNVYHYPDEFNLSLIKEHGWYTCPGKKRNGQPKNTSGVSRDHIISVSYGFANNIDPKIISHPANCRIMLHSDNKKKKQNCDLTVDILMEKIKVWDKKYTERRIGIEPITSCLEGKYSTN
jgi:hypothetical protein